jgi:uncharacterized protein YecT (DUF1311 family)
MPRDLLAEIVEIKARQGRLHRQLVQARVDTLARDWKTSTEPSDHFKNFVPVALVTAIEVYFRSFVAELIDHGDPYRTNAFRLGKDLRFDLRSMEAIQGKRVTVGEFVAHTLSYNKLSDIEAPLTTLIDTSFFDRLTRVVDHWAVNKDPATPALVTDLAGMKRALVKLFESRHIIVHEMPEEPLATLDAIRDFISAVQTLLSACTWLNYELLTPDAPLTQIEMTARAARDLREADEQARDLLDRLMSSLDAEGQQELASAQAAWEEYRLKESQFAAGGYRGGSAMPMMGAIRARTLTEARIESLLREIEEREGR